VTSLLFDPSLSYARAAADPTAAKDDKPVNKKNRRGESHVPGRSLRYRAHHLARPYLPEFSGRPSSSLTCHSLHKNGRHVNKPLQVCQDFFRASHTLASPSPTASRCHLPGRVLSVPQAMGPTRDRRYPTVRRPRLTAMMRVGYRDGASFADRCRGVATSFGCQVEGPWLPNATHYPAQTGLWGDDRRHPHDLEARWGAWRHGHRTALLPQGGR
jgi:hypothetical protein